MSDSVDGFSVEIGGNTEKLVDALEAGISKLGSFGDIAELAKKALTGPAGLVLAVAGTVAILQDLDKEFAGNQRSDILFQTAISNSKDKTSEFSKVASASVESIMKMTGASDDSAKAMITTLVSTGRTSDEISKMTTAAEGLANATGTSLDAAMTQLNTTFSGTSGRLGRLNPEISDLTKEQLAQGAAVDLLYDKYGKYAGALEESADVSMKRAKNASDELKAALGAMVNEALQPTRDWWTKITTAITDVINEHNKYKESLKAADAGEETIQQRITLLEHEKDDYEKLISEVIANGQATTAYGKKTIAHYKANKAALDAYIITLKKEATTNDEKAKKDADYAAGKAARDAAALAAKQLADAMAAASDTKYYSSSTEGAIEHAAAMATANAKKAASASETATKQMSYLRDYDAQSQLVTDGIIADAERESEARSEKALASFTTMKGYLDGYSEKDQQITDINIADAERESEAKKDAALKAFTATKGYLDKETSLDSKTTELIMSNKEKVEKEDAKVSKAQIKSAQEGFAKLSSYISQAASLYQKDADNKKDAIADALDAAEDAIDKELAAQLKAAGLEEQSDLEVAQASVKAAQDALDGKLSAIDAETKAISDASTAKQTQLDVDLQAELYSKGLASAATVEQYDAEIAAAIAAGDTETANELTKARDKLVIETDYRNQKQKVIDDAAAAQQKIDDQKVLDDAKAAETKAKLEQDAADKKTKLEQDAAMATYEVEKSAFEVNQASQIAQATIAGATGALNAFTSLAAVPVVGVGLGLAAAAAFAAVTVAEIAIIAGQKPPTKPSYAEGTDFAAGGLSIINEDGPELVNVPKGSEVTPAKKTAELLSGSGKGGDTISFNSPVAIDALQARRMLIQTKRQLAFEAQ
jgi:hypothetical protein